MTEPAELPAPEPPTATHYPLSEAAIEALADVAPALTGAELKVLLEIVRRELRAGHAIKASSRDLANACKLGRSNVVAAIDALTASNFLTLRQGTATTPATYQANVLKTVRMGGPVLGPPPAKRWSQNETTLDLFQDHGGPVLGPPPTENAPLTKIAAASDSDEAPLRLIDRVFSSKPKNFDKATIEEFRNHLYGLFARFGRDGDNNPFTRETLPLHPTDEQTAQFLTVADERSLVRFLQTFLHECQAGAHPMYSYMYFVYVALQRCAGIDVRATKQIRTQLRDIKRAGKTPRSAHLAEQLEFTTDILHQAVAGVKKLR